jgi:hypothetical protein
LADVMLFVSSKYTRQFLWYNKYMPELEAFAEAMQDMYILERLVANHRDKRQSSSIAIETIQAVVL